MTQNSKIEWTDHTFNPFIGCTKISPGCDHCYAEAMMDKRMHKVVWGAGQPRIRTSAANWRQPLKWNAEPFVQCECGWRGYERDLDHSAESASNLTAGIGACPNCNRIDLKPARQRVFCASLADVFDNEVPIEWRRELFDLIELTPNLDWLLLTKRIGNVFRMVSDARSHDWLRGRRNVWLGITVVNQEEADRDIPKLLAMPARVRFLSMEPLLGEVHLDEFHSTREPADGKLLDGIDWVIAGGESGRYARPMHPDWVRSLRDQCAAAHVPFLFKQNGEWLPWLEFGRVGIDDDLEQTRYRTAIWQGDHWEDCGFPIWCDMRDNYGGGANGPGEPDQIMGRVGKKAAGRLLDGVQHDGFPEVA